MSTLPKCGQSGCTGHLGKFSSCLDEAVYELTLNGFAETMGDSDTTNHYASVTLPDAESVHIGDGLYVDVPAGSYIAETISTGFVSVRHFADKAEFDAEWERLDAMVNNGEDEAE